VAWAVEYTDEFGRWWLGLDEREQESIRVAVDKLEQYGPALGRPLVDTIKGSRYPNMKELQAPGWEHPRALRLRPPARGDPPDRRGQDREVGGVVRRGDS
jgi:hypothetical protein